MKMREVIKNNYLEAEQVLREFFTKEENIDRIAQAAEAMVETLRGGGKILSCGNGGSLCDAAHFAEELSARFRRNRKALPAIAITDPAYITCVGNDFGFDHIYSRFIEAVGRQGDLLLAISTSGNSPNIVNAAREAHARGMKVVALTGHEGGVLAGCCDVEVRAPKTPFSDRAQEIHIKVIHTLCQIIEKELGID